MYYYFYYLLRLFLSKKGDPVTIHICQKKGDPVTIHAIVVDYFSTKNTRCKQFFITIGTQTIRHADTSATRGKFYFYFLTFISK